jgi:hypothetical protein
VLVVLNPNELSIPQPLIGHAEEIPVDSVAVEQVVIHGATPLASHQSGRTPIIFRTDAGGRGDMRSNNAAILAILEEDESDNGE